ncbi:MAG: hypothetical protein P8L82_04010 [Paracoccaceae bacterium]|nr:hypothetical protein [Paracoccaceae bacterium]
MAYMRRVFPKSVIITFFLSGFIADIFKAYLDLRISFRNQLNNFTSESRLLAYAFFISVVLFLERLPGKVTNSDIQSNKGILFDYVGMDLFTSLFFGPIFLYFLSTVAHLFAALFKGKASFFEARLAFFWSIIVASPLLLVAGLLQGLFPDGVLFKFFECASVVSYAWIFSVIFCDAERFFSHLPVFIMLLSGYLLLSYLVV